MGSRPMLLTGMGRARSEAIRGARSACSTSSLGPASRPGQESNLGLAPELCSSGLMPAPQRINGVTVSWSMPVP